MPSNIGRFRVDALLGSGGMGEVYKAFDPTLQRTIAVKTVRPDIDKPEYLERLYREAQACARLKHPNVVTVYEAGEIGGVVYIAMEYLTGEDLSTVIRRGGLSFERKIQVLIAILDALQHAHSENVIHRDIKPGNVHCLPDGSIKLVDFGLARVLRVDTLTETGTVMGTPYYASPEQLKGEPVDGRTDIYSTGAVAYEMLTGRSPFHGDNDSLATVILKVISEPLPPMDVIWTRRLPEIQRIITRAMAKSPDDRFKSAEELRDALSAFLVSSRDAIASIEADMNRSTGSIVDTVVARTALAETVASGPKAKTAEPESRASRKLWWWAVGAVAALVAAVFVASRQPMPQFVETAILQDLAVSTPTPQSPGAVKGAPGAVSPPDSSAPVAETKPSAPSPEAVRTTPAIPAVAPAITPAVPVARTDAPVAAASTEPPPSDLSAKQLFGSIAGSPAGKNAGLRFRLIQQSPDGGQIDVDSTTKQFQTGDRVKFVFDSNIDGCLYVVQQGSSGRWAVLFPSPQINGGRNNIRKGEQYQVPSDGWFAFDANPGTERVFVFLSREPLKQLPGFDRPITKTESIVSSVVEELQHSIRSRDLVFEKDASGGSRDKPVVQATYVVNRTELGQAVAASIELTHGQ